MILYALLSVSDKTGITDFANSLVSLGYILLSIQKITGNPESFDGRMKTISFQVESGLLYDRKNTTHLKEATALRISQIDVVACNLYPFEETVRKKSATHKEIVENIDVGGPTMIRAAAKNGLLVGTDPSDKAFGHLSFYDSPIAAYFHAGGVNL